ncbi:MAG: DegT/DnrJ/EryC1/StrS family aminotransferase [Ferruginibacter sp.]
MKPIQMVDTKTQYHKIKKEVDEAVIAVMESSHFIGGAAVNNFAANLAAYHGCKHVVPCANGTDALQIALMALDIKAGDEIITPSFTYIATVEVAALLGIRPVFVEVDKQNFCLDPEAVEAAITPKTKAIVPVHLYGQAAEMDKILALAKKHNLYVIEDNAQAIGNNYIFPDGSRKKTGTLGHIGCTSFYPSKNLGAYGDGGAMFTDDDALAEKLRMIASHGQRTRYYHEIVGCNSRLDAMQAAILDIKLKHLDEYNDARRLAADYYDEGFKNVAGLTVPHRASWSSHVFHQYTILVPAEKRDGLHEYLAGENVPSMIYYPVPAHRQKMFDAFGGSDFDLPVTDWLTERVISLPVHTELEKEQQDFIIEHVITYLTKEDQAK